MAKKKKTPTAEDGRRIVAQNRRARHDYEILDTVEAGIELRGSEVKSLRDGSVQIRDGFARVERGEIWLHNVHIAPWAFATGFGGHDPDRPRRLLLHRRQIDELGLKAQQQALTMVPLSLYFRDGRAKVDLAIARGRKRYDKRHAIAERDAGREVARAAARDRRGE